MLQIAGDTPVQRIKQGWSAVREAEEECGQAMYVARET